ncbi:MAG: ribosomal-protein-alanine acetyltransferase [Acidimicrobiia bacterium]|nr:ribosomal-protein-alanine acetyltransferase [Acidimicrobiia bacterium]
MSAMRSESPVPDPQATSVRVGPLKRRHLRAVMRIEQQVYPRPWTMGVFHGELALKRERVYLAAKVGSQLVGYAGAMLVEGDIHITNIAVDPQWHRHKIGTRLLATVVRQGIARGAHNLTLEVRVSNVGAQELYRRFGLSPAGMRRRYYENSEDAIVMWANDVHLPEYEERLQRLMAAVPGSTTYESLIVVGPPR